jgi:hypothetical protein
VITGLSVTVSLGDTDVVVRELTTAQTRAQLAEFERAADLPPDLQLVYLQLTDAPDEQLALRCLGNMTSAQWDELPDMPLSLWRTLLRACVECNPGFFRLAAVLQRLGQATPAPPAGTSSEPSAPS